MATLLLYLAIFLALSVFTNKVFHKIRNLPPSPYLPLPIIGHLYLLKKPLHRTLSAFNPYGSVLFFQFGFRPVLVVSSPEATEECLTKNDVVFANRPRLMMGKYLAYNYTQLAWAPYGDHWRNLRRISSLEILSTHRLQMMSDVRAEEMRSVIQFLLSKKDDDEGVGMRTMFFELTFNVMMRMIAGKRYYGGNAADLEEAKEFQDTATELHRLTGLANSIGDFLPFMRWIGLGGVEGGVRDGFRLLPFGSGRRGCPGEGLAMRMVGLALGSLIQCFEWERESEEEPVDMKEGAGFTLSRAQPLHLKCRPRPAVANLLSQLYPS